MSLASSLYLAVTRPAANCNDSWNYKNGRVNNPYFHMNSHNGLVDELIVNTPGLTEGLVDAMAVL